MSDIFYFKHLDIEYKHTEIQNFFLNRPIYNTTRFEIIDLSQTLKELPSIANWFTAQRLKPKMVALISVGGNSKQKIHKDVGESILAINFPVENYKNIRTYFYKVNENALPILEHSKDTNVPYSAYAEDSCLPICHYTVETPVLLNIKEPHSVFNHTNLVRYVLSFRFYNDPHHLI
jgi:hypothetical protein